MVKFGYELMTEEHGTRSLVGAPAHERKHRACQCHRMKATRAHRADAARAPLHRDTREKRGRSLVKAVDA